MKRNRFHKIIAVIIGACLCMQVRAQQAFQYKAGMDTVPQDGFYQVNLVPSIIASMQPAMADIRILDNTGKQVPYILKSDLPAFRENKFTGLPIISNKMEADKQVHVVIENTGKRLLNELVLVIKNTDANRMATLSGSDDNKNWYIIKENIYLNNFFSATAGTFIQALVFPNSNYAFFKITINGKNILPVNVVKAGIYEETFINGKYLPLPNPVLLQKDSGNQYSYIFIQFNSNYFIDRFELQVKGSRFYKRNMVVYGGSAAQPVELASYTLTTDAPAIYGIAAKTNHLLLKIRNDDNPPLQITNIAAFQLNRYLLTYLNKGTSYHLVWGDSGAPAPSYDLEAFKDSIGNNATVIGYGSIQKNNIPLQQQPIASNNKWLIWLAIAIVIIVLLALTYKLTKEVNKRNT
jgi:hypothetical protein